MCDRVWRCIVGWLAPDVSREPSDFILKDEAVEEE
jgi:hypothetical protein